MSYFYPRRLPVFKSCLSAISFRGRVKRSKKINARHITNGEYKTTMGNPRVTEYCRAMVGKNFGDRKRIVAQKQNIKKLPITYNHICTFLGNNIIIALTLKWLSVLITIDDPKKTIQIIKNLDNSSVQTVGELKIYLLQICIVTTINSTIRRQ